MVVLGRGILGWGLMRVVVWGGGGGGSGGGEAWVTGSIVGGCTGGAGVVQDLEWS